LSALARVYREEAAIAGVSEPGAGRNVTSVDFRIGGWWRWSPAFT
jgi:hypothetical protein